MPADASLPATFNYDQLATGLKAAQNDPELFKAIVNLPFANPLQPALIFLGIMVFLQVDKAGNTINRIALSETELAQQTIAVTPVPFHEIKIPMDHQENIIAYAITHDEPTDTTDWKFLFTPAFAAEQARINQANAGIAYSAVYPLKSRDGGALIFSYYQYQHEIGIQQTDFMRRYAALVDTVLEGKG